MAPPNDVDWEFLDTIISLTHEITKRANEIKEMSDDPDILRTAMYLESNGLLIWKQTRDYRERLKLLKTLAQSNGLPILEQISNLAEDISRLANGTDPPLVKGNGTQKNQARRGAGKPEQINK